MSNKHPDDPYYRLREIEPELAEEVMDMRFKMSHKDGVINQLEIQMQLCVEEREKLNEQVEELETRLAGAIEELDKLEEKYLRELYR